MGWGSIDGVVLDDVDGFSINGWNINGVEDDDEAEEVGDWQSIASQLIATGGALYDNRQARKYGRGTVTVPSGATKQIAPQWTPIPGPMQFGNTAPGSGVLTGLSGGAMPPWLLPAGLALLGGLLIMRKR